MIGRTHGRFWKHFDALPAGLQKLAREKYAIWRKDPFHPSLRFEERRNSICVVRIGEHQNTRRFRLRGCQARDGIATHAEYNRFRF